MVEMFELSSREEWLKHRTRIGGSDSATILGLNPYKTNVRLWEEKTGKVTPEDISWKPYVQFGHDAEPHIRDMFALDHPEYKVGYIDNNMWVNDKYPFAHASLDGWLQDADNRMGILEIKTTEISSAVQRKKWDNRIPDNYYCQILHYMAVTEFQFAILKARIKTVIGDEISASIRHYRIDRTDVEEDIKYLMEAEERFWRHVKEEKEPPLILPNI